MAILSPALTKKVIEKSPKATLILMSDNVDNMKAAAAECGDRKPLLLGANSDNWQAMGDLAKELDCPLGVRGSNLDNLVEVSGNLVEAGTKDMVIDTGARTLRAAFEDNVVARRSAVKEKFKPLGFPTITFPCEMTDDLMMEAMIASVLMAKYAGIIVLSDIQGDILFPLLLEQLNIFTDPQRPMVVTGGYLSYWRP